MGKGSVVVRLDSEDVGNGFLNKEIDLFELFIEAESEIISFRK